MLRVAASVFRPLMIATLLVACAQALPAQGAQTAQAPSPLTWTRVDGHGGALTLANPPLAKAAAVVLGDKERIEIKNVPPTPKLEIRVNNTVVFSGDCAASCTYAGIDRLVIPFSSFKATGGEANVEIKVGEQTAYFLLLKRWEWTAMQSPILFPLTGRIGRWRLLDDITPSVSPLGVRVYFHRIGFARYITFGTLLQTAAEAANEEGVKLVLGSYVDLSGYLQLSHVPAQHGVRQRFLVGVRPELLKKIVPSAEQK